MFSVNFLSTELIIDNNTLQNNETEHADIEDRTLTRLLCELLTRYC